MYFGVCKPKHKVKNFKKAGEILNKGQEFCRKIENAEAMIIYACFIQGLAVKMC